MVNTLDMQDLRYLKLFATVTRINTRYFFMYNNMLVFSVPKQLLSKAIGANAINLKKINSIVKKRVRVVPQPLNISDAKSFIEKIISPVTFNEIEITDDEIIVTAGKMNKAALIGRDKKRLSEMQKIISIFFKRNYRVI